MQDAVYWRATVFTCWYVIGTFRRDASTSIVQFRQIISRDVCLLSQLNDTASKKRTNLYKNLKVRGKNSPLLIQV